MAEKKLERRIMKELQDKINLYNMHSRDLQKTVFDNSHGNHGLYSDEELRLFAVEKRSKMEMLELLAISLADMLGYELIHGETEEEGGYSYETISLNVDENGMPVIVPDGVKEHFKQELVNLEISFRQQAIKNTNWAFEHDENDFQNKDQRLGGAAAWCSAAESVNDLISILYGEPLNGMHI